MNIGVVNCQEQVITHMRQNKGFGIGASWKLIHQTNLQMQLKNISILEGHSYLEITRLLLKEMIRVSNVYFIL